MTQHRMARQVEELSAKLGKHLAGKSPEVQSAALADCCAMHLAGHRVEGDPEATAALRATLLASLVELIERLVEPNAKEIDDRLKRARQ